MAYRAGRFPARNFKSRVRPQPGMGRSSKSKSIKSTLDNVAKIARKGAEFTETLANEPLDTVASTALKLSGAMKTPIGSLGLSLMPSAAKERSVSGSATGDVTTSTTMYAFRPPRKRNRGGEITYIQKATTVVERSTIANAQAVLDFNVCDATPILNNPVTNPYSRLTVKKCFDQYLTSRVETGTATYSLQEQQTSIHVKNISSELMIKNNSSSLALVDVYELVPQHTIGPSTYSSQTFATGYMSPAWAFNVGLTDVLEPEDNLVVTEPNAKPTDSSLWYRTWKVIKKVRVNLTGGSLHRHKSSLAVNKTVTYPEMAQFSTSGGKFAGWNPVYMVIQKGAPDNSNQAGISDITYTCAVEMRYQASSQEQARVIVYDQAQ